MTWKQAWAAVALAATLVGAPAQAQMVEGVAAIVNDQVISTYDVRQRANLLLASSGIQRSAEALNRAGAQALRDLIDERLQLQEAQHYEIAVSDDQINATIADIARQNSTTAPELTRQLGGAGINIQTLREQVRADIAWRRLINGRYSTRVRISPTEVSETQARIAQSAAHAQYLVSEIFIPAEGETELTEAQNGAQRLLQEMQRGAPFPLVARQFSAAPSAAAGGDLGWVTSGELQPEIQTVVDRLQPGQVSTPVRTQNGIYLIALRDRRQGQEASSTVRLGLRQISAPASSRGALERARGRITTCQSLGDAIQNVQGADIADLGVTNESDLSEQVRGQVNGLSAGQTSAVQVAGERASMIVVCTRDVSVAGVPGRDEIENRLFEQELAMLSQRYLRNLRREATIITR
ncbi:MAG: peptidylprolyl isomerase [Caulobacterales bacterium]